LPWTASWDISLAVQKIGIFTIQNDCIQNMLLEILHIDLLIYNYSFNATLAAYSGNFAVIYLNSWADRIRYRVLRANGWNFTFHF